MKIQLLTPIIYIRVGSAPLFIIIIIIINLLLLSATSDPRQITGNMSVAEMPLVLYNNLLRNT